jgi:spore maturation protein CgeB
MIADRTDEHVSLFVEGSETEFFESDEELVRKRKYYFAHDMERQGIARNWRNRCLTSGYSSVSRLGQTLDQVRLLT